MAKESAGVIPRMLMQATADGWRLFRNFVGQAWTGKAMQGRGGYIIIDNPKRVTAGLGTGSSDLVGWRPVQITQAMVGQTIAQFVAVECKTVGYGRTTKAQDNFLEQVAMAGGAAFLARETKDGTLEIIPIEAD